MPQKKPHPADPHEQRQIERASYFTTCRFVGSGRYQTEKHMSLSAAREAAGSCPRTMVYAVTPEGFTIPLSRSAGR
jgi:hypothetical protein